MTIFWTHASNEQLSILVRSGFCTHRFAQAVPPKRAYATAEQPAMNFWLVFRGQVDPGASVTTVCHVLNKVTAPYWTPVQMPSGASERVLSEINFSPASSCLNRFGSPMRLR